MRSRFWLNQFRAVTWVGIAANFVLGGLGLVDPGLLLGILGIDRPYPLDWQRAVFFLLVIVTLLYVPAAVDPVRNHLTARLAIVARICGTTFFALLGGKFLLFSVYDAFFCVLQIACFLPAFGGADKAVRNA